MNFTITRFDNALPWQAAIMPDSRAWILYVGGGGPYLYMRQEDVQDAATGDTLERYVLATKPPEPPMPKAYVDPERLTIEVTRTRDPGCIHPWIAVCDSFAGMGATRNEAVLDLLKLRPVDQIADTIQQREDEEAASGAAVLAL